MGKSGFITAAASFVVVALAAFLAGCCGPILSILLGAVAGVLACVFDKPSTTGGAAGKGAGAGAMAGIGALLGQTLSSIIVGATVGQQSAANVANLLGMSGTNVDTSGAGYWIGILFAGGCFGILDLLLMAGVGALAALIYFQIAAKPGQQPPAVIS